MRNRLFYIAYMNQLQRLEPDDMRASQEPVRKERVMSCRRRRRESGQQKHDREFRVYTATTEHCCDLRPFSHCFACTLCPTDRYALHGQRRPQDEHILHSGECAPLWCTGTTRLPVVTLTSCLSGAQLELEHIWWAGAAVLFVTCHRTKPNGTKR